MGNKHHDKYNVQRNISAQGAGGKARINNAERSLQARAEKIAQPVLHAATSGVSEIGETLSTELQSAKSALHGVGETVSHVASSAGSTLRDAGSATLKAIKANPIPIALTGVGLTWLAINALGGARSISMPSMSMPSMPKLSAVAGDSSKKVGQLIQGVGSNAVAMEQSVERVLRDNPLVIGAAMLAVGAAIGVALPATLRENTWFGKGRDEIVHKAQELARDAVSKVESVAKQVTGGATNGIARQPIASA